MAFLACLTFFSASCMMLRVTGTHFSSNTQSLKPLLQLPLCLVAGAPPLLPSPSHFRWRLLSLSS